MLFLSLLLGACATTNQPQIKYVDKLVEVKIKSPPQYRTYCQQVYLEANPATPEDIIVLSNRLQNQIEICNMIIKQRNEYEDKQ